MFPSARVIGTDIAPMQPRWYVLKRYGKNSADISRVPPNCHFEIDDAEDNWMFPKNSFDYIHARDFYHSIRDWPKLVRQSFA